MACDHRYTKARTGKGEEKEKRPQTQTKSQPVLGTSLLASRDAPKTPTPKTQTARAETEFVFATPKPVQRLPAKSLQPVRTASRAPRTRAPKIQTAKAQTAKGQTVKAQTEFVFVAPKPVQQFPSQMRPQAAERTAPRTKYVPYYSPFPLNRYLSLPIRPNSYDPTTEAPNMDFPDDEPMEK